MLHDRGNVGRPSHNTERAIALDLRLSPNTGDDAAEDESTGRKREREREREREEGRGEG